MHPRLRDVRRFGLQVAEDYPTHEEVQWWMRNHTNFPRDFLQVRRAYEDYKRKQGRTDNENDIGILYGRTP